MVRISLRWKMLLFVFVLVLAPVLILGFNEYRETKNMITDMLHITAQETLTNAVDFAHTIMNSVV